MGCTACTEPQCLYKGALLQLKEGIVRFSSEISTAIIGVTI
jgi:hypothetical protein